MTTRNCLHRWFAQTTSSQQTDRRRHRPQLEWCEARTLLTAFTVNALTDTGAGSGLSGDLRYCITQADKDTTTDTINFATSGTLNLSSPLPALSGNHSISITGTGAANLTVKGVKSTGNSGAFTVNSGTTATLAGMTISNATGALAGGIYSTGNLTLNSMTLTNNSGYTGGGIRSDGTLTVTNSTFSNNTATYGGGGLFLGAGKTTITASTVAGNKMTGTGGGGGGGIYNGNDALTVNTSTLMGNTASNVGGGLLNANTSQVSLNTSTITTNSAINGGGIENLSTGSLTAANCTIARNTASNSGGGIFIHDPYAVALLNSIIAANTTTGTTTANDIAGANPVAEANDVLGTAATALSGSNNKVNVINPGLGMLGYYGGPTQTIPLLAGSPALDAGYDSTGGTTDQRGAQRGPAGLDAGSHVDVGAFEATSSYLVTSTADTLDPGTLRSAIAWANQSTNPLTSADPNTVRFDTSGTFKTAQTIILSPRYTSLILTGSAGIGETILGPGAALLNVEEFGGPTYFPSFTINSGATASISGLSITGNNSVLNVSNATNGGAIGNLGKLTLRNSIIANNTATMGGGIYNTGILTINNSTISTNTAGVGGGIYNGGNGSLTITNSNIASNTANDYAGGLYNATTSSTTINNSTINNNSTTSSGGLDNYGTMTVSNSTIAGNSASTYSGGGISNGGTLAVTNSTIATNSAAQSGGGINNSGTLTLTSTIVASNTSTGSTTANDIAGTSVATTSNHNLVGTGGSGGMTNGTNGNIVLSGSATPGLGTLGSYGGSTQTIPLLPGSVAIDAGSTTATTPTLDQRGRTRVSNGKIDIGAFESQGFTLSFNSGTTPQSQVQGSSFGFKVLNVASPVGDPVNGGSVNIAVTPATYGGVVMYLGGVGVNPVTTATIPISVGSVTFTPVAGSQVGNYAITATTAGAPTPATLPLVVLSDGSSAGGLPNPMNGESSPLPPPILGDPNPILSIPTPVSQPAPVAVTPTVNSDAILQQVRLTTIGKIAAYQAHPIPAWLELNHVKLGQHPTVSKAHATKTPVSQTHHVPAGPIQRTKTATTAAKHLAVRHPVIVKAHA